MDGKLPVAEMIVELGARKVAVVVRCNVIAEVRCSDPNHTEPHRVRTPLIYGWTVSYN